MSQTQQIHRRKSSKDEDDIALPSPTPTVEISVPEEHELPSVTISAPPPRSRTQSTPHQYGHNRSSSTTTTMTSSTNPPSAGPFRTSFAPRPLNGHSLTSPFRSSFSAPMPPQMNGHSRTRSISTPFSPVSPSPLSSSFPISASSPRMSTSQSAPEAMQQQQGDGQQTTTSTSAATAAAKQSRRHSRMHSRNLSVFFPRPGSIPHSTISEDGAQEVEFGGSEEATLIPSAGSSVSIPGARRAAEAAAHQPVTPLGQGFTFGARPPSSLPTPEFMTAPRPASASLSTTTTTSSTSKRGHHHKHSLSHNFFSFLEPGAGGRGEELHTQPTPMPVSPWGPMSAIPPDSAASTQSGFVGAQAQAHVHAHSQTNGHGHGTLPARAAEPDAAISSAAAAAACAGQFVLGAWLWVVGQQVGSLACTGLGYWVVFDAFGVALAGVVPGWLASGAGAMKERERVRRAYGNGRVETVLMFAQAVYLVFSSVYVCKETVEHLLLSAGGGEGHHHHHGDEEEGLGIDFPIIMTFVTFISLLATAILFENNTKILNITGNRIPSLSSLIRSVWSPSRHTHMHDPPATSPIAQIVSNPFVASPLFFCVLILAVALFIPPVQHRMADLVLAFVIATLTFKVAYSASVVLGTVLLQTSPPRGLSSGKMEAFLRAMREVERHPQVVHLPAPHIWQLTPSYASNPQLSSASSPTSHKFSYPNSHSHSHEPLVVTLELHVRQDLGDDDVLKLTKWAWERCVSAIGSLKDYKEMGEEGGPEVTVGVVRG